MTKVIHRDIIVPGINMNGNTWTDLVEHVIEAKEALDKAQHAYKAMAGELGHGRNFVTVRNEEVTGNFADLVPMDQQARDGFNDRLATLDTLRRELRRMHIELNAQERVVLGGKRNAGGRINNFEGVED